MMGLFKKPNRKFRQRVAQADSDEEATEETFDTKDKRSKDLKVNVGTETRVDKQASTSSAPTLRDVPSKDDKSDGQPVIPATKLLSFHDEDDETEVFKLKKSNYSRRLAKQMEKERRKKTEALPASMPSTSRVDSKSETPVPDDNAKPTKDWNILSGKEAEDMDAGDDGENRDSAKENPFKNVLQSGIIPDAATIYAMKKHRQMAREMGDYIPLEDPEKDEEKLRLTRNDDNNRSDDDDEEEPSRLSFTVNTGAVERQKVREAFLSLQEGPTEELENEDAAELDRWEQEQIRKGVSLIAPTIPTQPQQTSETFYPYMSMDSEDSYYAVQQATIEELDSISKPLINFKDARKDELTTSVIKSRLGERLSDLTSMKESYKRELESCQKEMEEASELIETLEKQAPELSRGYSLYQQMRGYVRDLVECLDFKVAHIEVLDTKLMDLYKTRAAKLLTRRQLDIRDQSEEYSLLSSKILKGASSEIITEKNGNVDESRLRRAAEREGRRMRRRKQRERSQFITKHQDGMSSDDEEPDIEVIKFREFKDDILMESRQVFEDVVDDFGTIQGVMSNFEKWKHEQQESYVEAFVPLCLPKIFAPYARIQMLGWNPLEDDLDLESKLWYKSLILYSYDWSLEKSEDSEDPDTNLLPSTVEKVLIPKMTAFINDVWDPMSTQQTKNLVSVLTKLHEDYPTVNGKSKSVQSTLQAVSARILKTIDEDVFIPLYPKELLENRSLGSSIFFQRQFWCSVKLLHNILSWEGILAEKALQDMSLSSLVNRYLLMGLNTSMVMRDTLDKCKSIASSFPKSWFSTLKGSATLPQLKPFSQYLVKYGQSLPSLGPKRMALEDDEIRDTVKEIVQVLISINALDEAVALAKHFSISVYKK